MDGSFLGTPFPINRKLNMNGACLFLGGGRQNCVSEKTSFSLAFGAIV